MCLTLLISFFVFILPRSHFRLVSFILSDSFLLICFSRWFFLACISRSFFSFISSSFVLSHQFFLIRSFAFTVPYLFCFLVDLDLRLLFHSFLFIRSHTLCFVSIILFRSITLSLHYSLFILYLFVIFLSFFAVFCFQSLQFHIYHTFLLWFFLVRSYFYLIQFNPELPSSIRFSLYISRKYGI